MTNRHDFSDDPLLAQLQAADPISPTELPTASAPEAQQLLEATMASATPTSSTSDPGGTFTDPAAQPTFGAPPMVSAQSAPRRSRNCGQLAAAAAAILVLVMGVVVLLPSNTEPALAAVHGAAQTTAATASGRATTTFAVSGSDGVESGQALGELAVAFAGRDVGFNASVTETSGFASNELGGSLTPEGRYVDGVIYANFDGQWFAVEAPDLITDAALKIADPRNILLTAQQLLETEEVGETTVDGIDVTHYRSVVNLDDQTLGQAGWMAGLETQQDAEADGEIVVDLYVDGQDRMYRVDVTGDLQEPGGTGTAQFEVTTVFSDLDTDITIEKPADAQILDLGNLGDGSFFNEVEDFFGEGAPAEDD
jgi:hypothetical protein